MDTFFVHALLRSVYFSLLFFLSLLYVRSESAFGNAICIRPIVFMLRISSLFLAIIIIMASCLHVCHQCSQWKCIAPVEMVAAAQWSGNAEEGIYSFFHLIWFFFRGKCHAPQCHLSIERNLLSACVRENSSLENQNVGAKISILLLLLLFSI